MKAKPIVSNYVKERKILVKKSILLISHSQKVTDGIKEMIEQMQKSEEVQIFSPRRNKWRDRFRPDENRRSCQ